MTRTTDPETVHASWRLGDELAVIDTREEDEFARGHPLFAASLPLGRLELEVLDRFPRRDVPVVCYGAGHDRAARGARLLERLGYTDVSLLEGDIAGWSAAGYELFADVNSPSKAFGELVAEHCRTGFIAPEELERRLREPDADLVVLDARRFDEFTTMSIPSARNVPGGELVYRADGIVERATTQIVVNCAGRTRSIIGAQSLRNAGYSNPVAALRNGTIGWTLAGLRLDEGASTRFDAARTASAAVARRVHELARALGIRNVDEEELAALVGRADRTIYRFDVRERDEFEQGHAAGFLHAPGGQLVQETDAFAPVRGATIVCCDDDGLRAEMAATWLTQMGWEVVTVRIADAGAIEDGPRPVSVPPVPEVARRSPESLGEAVATGRVRVLDLSFSRTYQSGHIPGTEFALRGELPTIVASDGTQFVLTSEDGRAAAFAADELDRLGHRVGVLAGGTAAWRESGHPLSSDDAVWTSPPTDRYRRPYEGTDVDRGAMEAYLEWEYGLVAQLERDGAHRFSVFVP